jgi:hypothetical protein
MQGVEGMLTRLGWACLGAGWDGPLGGVLPRAAPQARALGCMQSQPGWLHGRATAGCCNNPNSNTDPADTGSKASYLQQPILAWLHGGLKYKEQVALRRHHQLKCQRLARARIAALQHRQHQRLAGRGLRGMQQGVRWRTRKVAAADVAGEGRERFSDATALYGLCTA